MVAVIAAPVVLGAVWAGGIALAVLVALAAGIAVTEFFGLVTHLGRRPLVFSGYGASGILVTASITGSWSLAGAAVSVLVLIGSVETLVREPQPGRMEEFSLTCMGVVVVVWPLSFAIWIRSWPETGLAWLLVALFATWAYDTGAYAAGRLFGQHSFMARISPKKTWEGVAGGLVLAALITGATGYLAMGLPWLVGLMLGVVLGAATQAGDLIESFYKRQAGVKDSGKLLPGHGGVLDRIDGLLMSLVTTYYCGMVISGLHVITG